jgi:hypothetical protein
MNLVKKQPESLNLLGGAGRSRTDLLGFAVRCITALLPRREGKLVAEIEKGESRAFPCDSGAGEESRTLDLYLGKVSLYQLSYSRRTERDYTQRLPTVNAKDDDFFVDHYPLIRLISGQALRM